MALIDDLRQEHARIEQGLGALRTYLHGPAPLDAAVGADFATFLTLYAGHFHHAREEEVLFPALVAECALPGDRGPMAVLRREHRELAALLAQVEPGLRAPPPDEAGRAALRQVADRYTEGLLRHLDAENSVLLPEAEERLRRAGVHGLAGRGPTDVESEALSRGLALVARFPPTFDGQLLRGEGCVFCPSYGVSCDGLEREWWNESEWEEAPGRASSGG